MFALGDKTAIITGASSGIGRAMAELFAAQGAQLVLNARRSDLLDDLVADIRDAGGIAVAVPGNITDEAISKHLVEATLDHFGKLDIAVNNAGMVGESVSIPDMAIDDWHEMIETNLTSAFFGAKYQLPAMLANGSGSMILTSSFVGHTVGMPGMGAYAASKAGMIGLMKSLAAEYGPQGIRVNALLPGGTDTPASITNKPGAGPEVEQFVNSLHALKRMAKPSEIAQAALFLVSDAASFVTGVPFLADGGVSINRT
ncbi:SDR family oxidoreductase [Thalassospira xianhensis]|uniref:Short-chain dehydrogenase n=1 Tax=Thalassospira xianhensis MCCC 1A02616 TaxID=1177929 RepID=A0A367UAM1_9PROT|nr:SDR family oxidoreductase [Thalassospira xianhensis]RCK05071.1 short-chain dehydrogenase [Thalassospira xianhensis MCCC 1A02616]